MNKILSERTRSGFPVSIGTGLALETLFDPIEPVYDETREVPPKIDLSDYDVYIFNTLTLLRNIINAIDNNALMNDKVSVNDLYEALVEEIEFLQSFFEMNRLVIKFYVHTYDYIYKTYSKIENKLRVEKTFKQVLMKKINEYVVDRLFEHKLFKHCTKEIKYDGFRYALIFTHIPFDLLSYSYYAKFDLLESHTGVIKTRKEFNTKYYPIPNKDMSILPFTEKLLVSFGDKVHFHPDPLKDRIALYALLVSKKVHPLLSEKTLAFKGIK